MMAGLVLMGYPLKGHAQTFIHADVRSVSTNAIVTGDIAPEEEISKDQGLYLLPYYIQFDFPAKNFTAWGMQLYTNNSSRFTTPPTDGVYGGLRGNSTPAQKTPLFWQVYSSPPLATSTVKELGFYQDITYTPEDESTLKYWGLVKDRNDDDLVDNWMSMDNLLNRTLVSYQGLGKYPQAGRTENLPPIFLYMGIDVSGVTESQEFGTTLCVDLYNLGIDITSGGYATPNPFTPVTGQKTSFNFFLKNIDSGFKIKIFTIRGRLIRTITTEREWDGRNDSGRWVEGGVYIYQVEAENQRVSGTVVLIK